MSINIGSILSKRRDFVLRKGWIVRQSVV